MRRQPPPAPPSKSEIADDLQRSFEDDERTLEELKTAKKEAEEKHSKQTTRNQAKRDLYQKIEESIESAKNTSGPSKVPEEHMRTTLHWFKHHYLRGHDPSRYDQYEDPLLKEKHELEAKIKGGRLANGEDIEEVL